MAWLHRDEHLAHARDHTTRMLRGLLAEAAHAGDVRADIAPAELATYCLHALTAAGALSSDAAVHRLVEIILNGLRPPREPRAGVGRPWSCTQELSTISVRR